MSALAPALIQVQLSDEQAWALAEFLKRMAFNQWRALAADDQEAQQMQDAGQHLRQALAEQGFAPR